MKKMISLIKACMTDNMNVLNIKNKRKSKSSKLILPLFVFIAIFFSVWSYANMIIEPLVLVHAEHVMLTIFILLTTFLTIVEGIYKTGNLLFNCKDDNLMFSLPIKRSTVLFIRVFKFYVFELLYNSLFLIPAMIAYIRYVPVNASFYITSVLALLLLPVIPIVISCIIGGITSSISSKFKFKNIAQIIITMLFILLVFYASFNLKNIIQDIASNATSINDTITKLYYPAGAYIKLITDFNIVDLLVFVGIHLALFTATIILLGKVYFKINSSVKTIKTSTHNNNNNTEYKIKASKPIKSLIKKELNRFINSPVFVTNAAFGLVLYLIACVLLDIRFDGFMQAFIDKGIPISVDQLKLLIPIVQLGLICFSSLMSSITSSMISLEGKTFNILKSLPIKPSKIILSKVYTAVLIMIPIILIGDLIVFIKFQFNILEILMILIASVILPLVAEIMGIIVNLKYPKMNASNDTEVVKQSTSSMIAVLGGMILTGITIFLIVTCIKQNISTDLTMFIILAIYIIIYIALMFYLKYRSAKQFNSINV